MSQEEIFVPEGWVSEKLGKMVSVKHGHQFRSHDFVSSDGFKVCKMGQLKKNGVLDLSNCDKISKERLNEFSDYLIKKGDLLVSLTGDIGTVVKVTNDVGNLFQNYRVGKFTSKFPDKLLPNFLFYFLKSNFLKSQIDVKTNNAVIGNVGKNDLENMVIIFPKFKIQTQIVKKLDHIFEQVKEKRKSIKVKNTEWKKFHKLSFDKFLVDALDGKLTRDVTLNTEKTIIGDYVDILNGYAFKSEWFVDQGIKLVRNINIQHGDINWTNSACITIKKSKEFDKFKLKIDDIVLSLDRPLISTGLKIAKITPSDLPSLLLQRVAKFELKDSLNSDYFYYWLQSQNFIKNLKPGRSDGVPHISTKDLKKIKFNPPDIDIQKKIVKLIETEIPIFNKLQEKINSSIAVKSRVGQYLDYLESSILNSTFSGKLVN
jgi:restriction endonuclease S subunit